MAGADPVGGALDDRLPERVFAGVALLGPLALGDVENDAAVNQFRAGLDGAGESFEPDGFTVRFDELAFKIPRARRGDGLPDRSEKGLPVLGGDAGREPGVGIFQRRADAEQFLRPLAEVVQPEFAGRAGVKLKDHSGKVVGDAPQSLFAGPQRRLYPLLIGDVLDGDGHVASVIVRLQRCRR